MKLSFHGAAEEVTGSCYIIENAQTKIMVDCGMFQGTLFSDERNHAAFPFDPRSIDAVVITHAHLDHTGRLPKLVAAGFTGKIYATAPTIDLTNIILEDALEVMSYEEEKRGHKMVFSEIDVANVKAYFHKVDYDKKIDVALDATVRWYDAGHILGSSFVEIEIAGKRIVFSGDLGNRNVPIMRELEALPTKIDALILESTYGGHLHEDTAVRTERLRQVIIQTVKNNGVLMIPAFAVERIQEILYELHTLINKKKIPRVPIFLDSPLAIRATDIFKKYPEYYNAEAVRRMSEGEALFEFSELHRTLTRNESRAINNVPAPKVIIAGAGMMTGGRILHHLRRYLSDMNSTLLIVGYQADRTLGRQLLNGAREVDIYGQFVRVNAKIEKLGGYSAHADRDALVNWVAKVKKTPGKIFITHGEQDSRVTLAHELHDKLGLKAELPAMNSEYPL